MNRVLGLLTFVFLSTSAFAQFDDSPPTTKPSKSSTKALAKGSNNKKSASGSRSTASSSSTTQERGPSVLDRIVGADRVRGIYVELQKPLLDGKASRGSSSLKGDFDDAYAVSVGYKIVEAGQFGFSTGATYMQGKVKDDGRYTIVKIDGNGTYGLNQWVHLKAGINASKLQDGPGKLEKYVGDTGIGFQAGIGFNINQMFAVDLRYLMQKQEGSIKAEETEDGVGGDIKIEENGVEFAISATF